jgi:glutamate--cysteine ligase catalytic subunit
VNRIRLFLDFLLARAKGEVKTGAKFIRDFVLSHPDYKNDSIVSEKISFDLMASIVSMSKDPEQRGMLLTKKW